MSGTSLDGLDLAFVKLTPSKGNQDWTFDLLGSQTVQYSEKMTALLKDSIHLSTPRLLELDIEMGKFFGEQANLFLKENKWQADFIASHGHTVFHQPEREFTWQIGNGYMIGRETGLPVVANFRSLDVALGGQGAPLVPVGDKLLFPEYAACINLGGFSNISADIDGVRIAFDMGPANNILNILSSDLGKSFDENGELGRRGKLHKPLFQKLNALEYYKKAYPKSLGFEWMEEVFLPVFTSFDIPVVDKLFTAYHHICKIISDDLQKLNVKGRILVTGGGALNGFLMEILREKVNSNMEIEIPRKEIINYKEAIVFALLGALRWISEPNCLRSVTGASRDNSGGIIYRV